MTSRHVTPDFPRTIHLRVQAQFACLELAQEPLCSTALLIQRYFGPLALVLPTIRVVTAFGLTPHLSQLWSPTFQPCTQRTPRPICTTDGLHFQPPASKKGQKGKCCPFSCGHNRKQLPFPTWNQKSVFLLRHLPALIWVYICPRGEMEMASG